MIPKQNPEIPTRDKDNGELILIIKMEELDSKVLKVLNS
jgi:hypothetical protein